MRAVKIHGTIKKIHELVKLSKQALRDGAYRVAGRLHVRVRVDPSGPSAGAEASERLGDAAHARPGAEPGAAG